MSDTSFKNTPQPLSCVRLGVAGLGTVGANLVKLIQQHSSDIKARTGVDLFVTAVSARDQGRDRGFDMTDIAFETNPVQLANRDDVDIIVELIGGAEGAARDLAEASFAENKPFVTANKALLAHHGPELAFLAEQKNLPLKFEAAVAGGIPIIKALKEGLAGNRISSFAGILNGTCNYILTEMANGSGTFGQVLAEAQRLGYAEADPGFDVDGLDTAHKTAILLMLAFGVRLNVDDMPVTGVRRIDTVDIVYAKELGYCIRLAGFGVLVDGWVDYGVAPVMVKLSSPLSAIQGPTNAVVVQSDPVGRTVYEGPGAGGGATASAVLADILDIARSPFQQEPVFGVAAALLDQILPPPLDARQTVLYIRLRIEDKIGVIADIAHILAESEVSIDRLLQRGTAPQGGVYVVIITHPVTMEKGEKALARFRTTKAVLEAPTVLRVQ